MKKDDFAHMPCFKGLVQCSLGAMIPEYASVYVPGVNLYGAVRGTLQIPPRYHQGFEQFLERYRKNPDTGAVFAMLAHAEGGYRYIGHTSIDKIRWPDAVGTTGSVMFSSESQGQGYGTEAKLLLLYYCFFILGLRNVRSSVKGWNAQSMGHLVKCGYKVIGMYEKIVFHEGRWIDEYLLQVRREDFELIWNEYQTSKQLPKLTHEQKALITKQTQD